MNACLSMLAFGEKYKTFAAGFVKSCLDSTAEPPPIVIVSDSESGFDSIRRVAHVTIRVLPKEELGTMNPANIRPDGTIRGFDYSLKRFGFREALKEGFTSICLIDADMTVREWTPSVFAECGEEGLWAGHAYSAAGFGVKPVQHLPDLKFTPKLEALRQATGFECDWIAFRMPFEAALFLRESAARIAEFLDSWDELSALVKQLGLPLNAGCHEIALAAAKSGVNIRVRKELLSRVFKHHILNHDTLMRLHEEAGLRP